MFARQFSAYSGRESEAKITNILIVCCVIASAGGFTSGYCMGVIGLDGIRSMDSFLNKFYPAAYRKMTNLNPYTSGNYCLYDDFKEGKPFSYSSFLATLTATFLASYTTRRLGRRHTMLTAGVFFVIGIILSTAAQNLAMLFIGGILLGCGVGFAYQSVLIYLSEIAPTRIRGALNILFQLNVRVGMLIAYIVNYGTGKIRGWGWRLSLGLAGIPAAIFTIGSFFIVETPNSLIERGHLEKGKAVLRKIRGINNNIEPQLFELVEAGRVAKQVKNPFKNLLNRRNRPQLIMTVIFQTFHLFTGFTAIKFYVQVVLETIGYDPRDVHLYAVVTIEVVNVISTTISMLLVDKIGRRKLLLEAGLHMFLSHFLIAIILGIKVKDHSANLSHGLATFVVILICTFFSSYSWSWGTLSLLISSETFPLETRSAGQSVTICVFFISVYMTIQIVVPMLCSFKSGLFLFFSGWVLVMSLFVLFFLPETKNIPIEDIRDRVWKRHWFWKRFLDD